MVRSIHGLIIRMRHVPFLDSTGVHNLKEAIRNIQVGGTTVMLSGINQNVLKDLFMGESSNSLEDRIYFRSLPGLSAQQKK